MRASIAAARIALCLCLCGPVAVPALLGQTGTGRLGLDSNSAPYGTPRDYTIAATEVRGLSTLDEKGLITRSGLEPGKVISLPGDATANAIKNLWKLKLFSDISISIERVVGDQVFLVIETRELPRVSKFSLSGVKKGESDDLRERIALIRGTPYKDHVRQNIINQVQSYYGDKGFIKASAEVIERADTLGSNNIILDIAVDKGPKVRIDRIAILGNEALDDGTVRRKMKDTKEKFRFDPFTPRDSLWRATELIKPANIAKALTNISVASVRSVTEDRFQLNFFSSSKFQEATYEVDKNLIIQHYNTKGYRDARIASDSVYFSDEKNLNIVLTIDEGPRYHFRHITWSGNSKYSGRQKPGDPAGKLDSVLTIQRGDLYNAERLEQKLQFDPNGQDVTSLYMDDGYLFFGVTPVEVRVENDSIDLEIRVSEGPQAIVRNVIIRGNTRTNEHVIRREIRSRPGDKFSRNDLIRTQREIAALGYFDPQQIGMNPIPNPTDGTVDLEFTVVEKPSDQLELSAGWGGVGRGVVGSVGVSFNNFSIQNMFKREAWKPLPQGDGQRLSFRVNSNGRLFQSYNMSFTEPWLGGKKPNSFTVSLFRTLLSNNLARNAEGRRSFATDGGTLAYGIRLPWPDDFFSLLVAISIQHYTLQDWTQSNFFLQNGSLYNLSTNFTLARNSAGPNPFFPQQGSNLALTLGVTPPYSAFSDKNYGLLPPDQRFRLIEYHKWRFNAEWFTPMMGKFVLRSSAKLGFIGFYNPAIGHSSFEQFQLGGDGLANFNLEGFDVIALRGYQPFQNTNGATINSPIFNKFSLEMRYPISLNPSSTVYAHLFAEGGNLYSTIDQYNPFELRRSVGFGVRAFLPMFGLLGIDYGIRFDDGPTEPLLRTGNVFDYILNNGRFNIILGFEPE
jgi:outer membrane protein insertion porin family